MSLPRRVVYSSSSLSHPSLYDDTTADNVLYDVDMSTIIGSFHQIIYVNSYITEIFDKLMQLSDDIHNRIQNISIRNVALYNKLHIFENKLMSIEINENGHSGLLAKNKFLSKRESYLPTVLSRATNSVEIMSQYHIIQPLPSFWKLIAVTQQDTTIYYSNPEWLKEEYKRQENEKIRHKKNKLIKKQMKAEKKLRQLDNAQKGRKLLDNAVTQLEKLKLTGNDDQDPNLSDGEPNTATIEEDSRNPRDTMAKQESQRSMNTTIQSESSRMKSRNTTFGLLKKGLMSLPKKFPGFNKKDETFDEDEEEVSPPHIEEAKSTDSQHGHEETRNDKSRSMSPGYGTILDAKSNLKPIGHRISALSPTPPPPPPPLASSGLRSSTQTPSKPLATHTSNNSQSNDAATNSNVPYTSLEIKPIIIPKNLKNQKSKKQKKKVKVVPENGKRLTSTTPSVTPAPPVTQTKKLLNSLFKDLEDGQQDIKPIDHSIAERTSLLTSSLVKPNLKHVSVRESLNRASVVQANLKNTKNAEVVEKEISTMMRVSVAMKSRPDSKKSRPASITEDRPPSFLTEGQSNTYGMTKEESLILEFLNPNIFSNGPRTPPKKVTQSKVTPKMKISDSPPESPKSPVDDDDEPTSPPPDDDEPPSEDDEPSSPPHLSPPYSNIPSPKLALLSQIKKGTELKSTEDALADNARPPIFNARDMMLNTIKIGAFKNGLRKVEPPSEQSSKNKPREVTNVAVAAILANRSKVAGSDSDSSEDSDFSDDDYG